MGEEVEDEEARSRRYKCRIEFLSAVEETRESARESTRSCVEKFQYCIDAKRSIERRNRQLASRTTSIRRPAEEAGERVGELEARDRFGD